MPPMVIDLRRSEDFRDVVHRAVQALAEGRPVAFPTETDYVIASSARIPAAAELLRRFAAERADEPRLTLALKSADETLDWAPRITSVGRRLARRCWPGPVAMIVPDDHPESLLKRLPELPRQALVGAGRLRLRVPGHPLLADCMRMLAGPVMLAEPVRGGGPVVTAEEVVELAGESLALVLDDGRARYAQVASTIELVGEGFEVVRPGIVPEETLRRLASLMVLFVCTGNTCRSPMAEAIFRGLAAERLGCPPEEVERHGVVVASAGLAAWAGGPATPAAVEAAAELRGDLRGHESQPLSEGLVRQADVILTMTASHRAALLAQFPEAGGRVAMLSPDRRDVLDPIGGSLETYRKCAAQIREHLAARLDTLGLPDAGRPAPGDRLSPSD
jgi:protein-tyrosine-phosphatase/tRNA A37 threonylcarbamoyladenosine synthetase subunit TsaC/SUA5/YrdC